MSELENLLAEADDLGAWQAALVRERVIRETMVASGEGRAIVVDMINALVSMGEEGVLELTEGEPTTLHAAVQHYVESLEAEVYGVHEVADLRDRVVRDLGTLLAHSWPGAPIEITPAMIDAFGAAWEKADGGENVVNCYEHNMGDCPFHKTAGTRRRAGLVAALTSAGFQVHLPA